MAARLLDAGKMNTLAAVEEREKQRIKIGAIGLVAPAGIEPAFRP